MDRIKRLNKYQKGFLVAMIVMVLVFTVAYPVTISRVGFEYNGAILVPHQENDSTVYTGRVDGETVCFTVSEDHTVVYQYGEQTSGPYTAIKDPTAVPKDHPMRSLMTGVEVYKGDEILFRGAIYDEQDSYTLYHENGLPDVKYSVVTSSGEQHYVNGKKVDPAEPSASVILQLMDNPELNHKGDWYWWFLAVFLCIFNTGTILFADELFHWGLIFHIRNAEDAEPSEWELATRYIGWSTLLIAALVCFYQGITVVPV